VLKRGARHVVNRAATALRMAAWSLFRSRDMLIREWNTMKPNIDKIRSSGSRSIVMVDEHRIPLEEHILLPEGRSISDR
jgi:hypothetical protein